MDDVISGNHGIGLITPQFQEFYINGSYNYGKNHSIILYESSGNIYLVLSDEFDQGDKSIFNYSNHNSTIYDTKQLTKNGSTITVEIDMKEKTAKFTNNEDTNIHFELKNLPEKVALAFTFGLHPQTVSCASQQFF